MIGSDVRFDLDGKGLAGNTKVPMTGVAGESVQFANEVKSEEDCSVNPSALVGHVKMRFASQRAIVSCGGKRSKEKLNTVPTPTLSTGPVVP